MFQFLRRVSGSFLPRPDRPWRDDATSHAPTIGRKRRHSVIEQDGDRSPPSVAKRTKNDSVKSDTERDSESGRESPKADATPLPERRGVKEVTKGVKEVDLEDKDMPEDASSIEPEGVPLPDSPSASPQPESKSEEPVPEPAEPDEVEEEHADDNDFVASSATQDDAEKESEAYPASDTSTAETAPAQEVTIAIQLDLHDALETVELKA